MHSRNGVLWGVYGILGAQLMHGDCPPTHPKLFLLCVQSLLGIHPASRQSVVAALLGVQVTQDVLPSSSRAERRAQWI